MTTSLDRVAGSNFAYQHRPLPECLDDLAALGRDRVELWGTAPQLHVPWVTDRDAAALRREVTARGMRVVCFTPEQVSYPVNIASPDARLRSASVEFFLRAAEIAAELGSGLLLLTSGRGFESEPREHAWVRSVDAIGRIATRAAELGVTCVLEPLQRVESNLVTTAADTARVLAEVGDRRLGAVLDTVAMAVAGETVDDYADLLGDRLLHAHLIDGAPDGHLAWGEGELPLADLLADFDRRGYAGDFTVELFGDGSYAQDPRPVLARSLELIAAALPATGR
ncbi:sugar phosphate isomerase/epimerase family protein [Kineococcus sp. SYSU DK002]|uniref:sugar phosphate isomerase/epimerase family protein n=1 Tax=Kineococcus sp. SYSU DK002 TaxID=3383123 RepID=UPI003D7E8F53